MTSPSLNYRVQGEGPPALFVHGLAASSHVYEPLLKRAASLFRCIVVDVDTEHGPWAFPALTEALHQVVERERAQGALWVGHSFGGVATLAYAAHAPRSVGGLILAASPAMGLGPWVRRVAQLPWKPRVVRFADRLAASPPLVERYVRWWMSGSPRAVAPEQLRGYVRAMRRAGITSTLQGVQSLCQYQLPAEALRRAGLPTVVLWGDRDRLVPLAQGERVASALQAPLRVLPGAGHCLPEERPEVFLEEMMRLRRTHEERREP